MSLTVLGLLAAMHIVTPPLSLHLRRAAPELYKGTLGLREGEETDGAHPTGSAGAPSFVLF